MLLRSCLFGHGILCNIAMILRSSCSGASSDNSIGSQQDNLHSFWGNISNSASSMALPLIGSVISDAIRHGMIGSGKPSGGDERPVLPSDGTMSEMTCYGKTITRKFRYCSEPNESGVPESEWSTASSVPPSPSHSSALPPSDGVENPVHFLKSSSSSPSAGSIISANWAIK